MQDTSILSSLCKLIVMSLWSDGWHRCPVGSQVLASPSHTSPLRFYAHTSGESPSRCSLSSPCRTRSLLVTEGKLGSLASQSGSLQPTCALVLPSQPHPGDNISRAVFLTPPFPPCSAGLSPSSAPTVTFLASGGLPLSVPQVMVWSL